MKKVELVYNEILRAILEGKAKEATQAAIASALGISLSTVNHALEPLRRMGAIKVELRRFRIIDAKKILLYWAGVRNIEKDIIYSTRVDASTSDIEKQMPPGIVFAAYSALKFIFKRAPADYSEVYVYADEESLEEMKKRFPTSKNPPNLFVLRKDINKMTLAILFVDFWNLREWYAKDFLKEVGDKIDRVLA